MDLKDLIESFFVESFEGLDAMENGLLKLKPGPVAPEAINDIFRVAHSIKGGGGVFGFTQISEFMHGIETLLDELRSDLREATDELLALLLKSVDCTRQMLIACRDQQEPDYASVALIERQIQALLKDNNPDKTPLKWLITFIPDENMLAKANDPLRMFKDLAGMGILHSEVRLDRLPDFEELDPKKCHLSWQLSLQTTANQDAIDEVFSWVLDECQLEIIAQADGQAISSPARRTTQPATPATNKWTGESQSVALDSIRVSIDKIDKLINLVGELVITQSMLSRLQGASDNNPEDFDFGFSQLVRNTRDLQESVLQIRMLPIRFCFDRFPRLVHDMSIKLGKQVNLQLTGEETELDLIVLEKINGPLIHLVRNSLDHGLETRAERTAAGKPEIGTIELKAYHQGSSILIEVIDDGRGLDLEKILARAKEQGLVAENDTLDTDQIISLIFQPGFSTADSINDVSGRGVGMDVVKRNINEVGGDVWVQSQAGTGTKITIKLPLTLAILEGQLLRVGTEIYVIPLISIVETLQIIPGNINRLPGDVQVYKLRDQYLPIIHLDKVLSTGVAPEKDETGLLIAVEWDRQLYAIWVSELMDQQQVVIKSLESNFKSVKGVSGATILGDGTVALILDVMGIIQQFNAKQGSTVRRLAELV
ncbi:MAG TPA: chemotaxis protein CheA [Gammaproteobacteria bacterium]